MHIDCLAQALEVVNSAAGLSSEPQSADSARFSSLRRPLKICLLGYRSAPYGGGQGIYLKYLSRALVAAGHQVDVISGQPYPQLDPSVTLIKLPGLNLYETGLGSLRLGHLSSLTNIIEWTGKLTGAFSEPYCFGRRVFKFLKAHGRDYDIVHDNQSLSWGVLSLQKKNFPLVTTIHHPITSDLSIALNAASGWRERLLIRRWHSFLKMQKKVAQRLSHVITVSDCSRQDIITSFGLRPESITRVYSGIDVEEFAPRPSIARVGARLMATASADAPLKGLRYLLEAVAQLTPKYPELELMIVGKPKPGGETEQLIEQLQIAPHLRFVSHISTAQLVDYYAEAQLAIVPSVYEGFGLPAAEAMACGVPLITTDGGALPEVVGEAAVQVPVKDSMALARAIEELLENATRREQLSREGRAHIVSQFCWQRAAAEMTEYYHRVISNRPGRECVESTVAEVGHANG